MQTIRKQLITLLSEKESSGKELSQRVGVREKEIYEHLCHISRTVNAQRKRLIITPSQCLRCGYVFKDRKRFSPPSRCPHCKNEHIQDPVYRIS